MAEPLRPMASGVAEDNPVARLLSQPAHGSPRWLTLAYLLAPGLLTAAWALGSGGGGASRRALLPTLLVAVPLPTLLLFFVQFEWHLNRLIARFRRLPVAEDLILSALSMDDILGGIAIAAQRHAVRDRAALLGGALGTIVVLLAWTRDEEMLATSLIAALLLVVLQVQLARSGRRLEHPRFAFEGARTHALTLVSLANRGPLTAAAVTWLQPLALLSLLALFWDKWAGMAGVATILLTLFAAGTWLSREAVVEADDAFATAFRRHLREGTRVPGRRTDHDRPA